ncbi:uncharacterized protein TrAFT101_001870 [Trichoderma asperellum]|nr:hypothetical protein TrAFT101_001870 [Trichoderma asperellum]
MDMSSPSPHLPPSSIVSHDDPAELERNIQQLDPKDDLVDVSELGLASSEKSSYRDAEERREPLSRILTNVSSVLRPVDITSDPGPPPDGGKRAWAQAIAGHMVVLNTWGYISSFGVFQTFYTDMLDRSPSDISWIGSVQIFLLFFIGVLAGRISDAGYFRQLVTLGFILQMIGIFTTSVATQYWQIFLSQGICMGLGNGCLFCPSLAVVSTYFSKRRALAIGIMSSGTGVGGLVFPSIARQLLPSIGFGWTVRTIGFVQLVTLGAALLALKPRVPPRKSGPLFEFAAFKDPEYSLYVCGSFFCFLALYFAYYYVASFGREKIGLSYADGLNLLLVINSVGITGRIAPNFIADRLGPITVLIPFAAFSGIGMLCWMAVKNVAGLYVWIVFYGTFAGGVQSLVPAGLSSLTIDLQKAGVRLGMMFTVMSFAALTGPPIAGQIISAAHGAYFGAEIFAGISMLIGSLFFTAAKWAKCRRIEGSSIWKTRV